jgi:hypothetical protein
MNSDPPVWEEVRQGFLLSFCSQPLAGHVRTGTIIDGRHQSWASGLSKSTSRSGISKTFKAAASIAYAWVGKASAELIDTPFE